MTVTNPNLYAICDEYGVPRNTPFPGGFYGKPGFPAFGGFSFNQCVGLSNVLFTPNGGSVSKSAQGSATVTLTCNQPAVWTYSGGGGATSSASLPSGSTSTSISFTVTTPNTIDRSGTWNVHGAALGVGKDFSVTCIAQGS